MKITTQQLRQIIKEEARKILREGAGELDRQKVQKVAAVSYGVNYGRADLDELEEALNDLFSSAGVDTASQGYTMLCTSKLGEVQEQIQKTRNKAYNSDGELFNIREYLQNLLAAVERYNS